MPATTCRGAELIAERRREAGKSGRQAAIAAGISPTHWMDVERSRASPSDAVLAKMAAVLWITPAELKAIGKPEAAAELTRVLKATPADQARREVRALVERIGAARHMTEGQKRALFDRIMRAVNGEG